VPLISVLSTYHFVLAELALQTTYTGGVNYAMVLRIPEIPDTGLELTRFRSLVSKLLHYRCKSLHTKYNQTGLLRSVLKFPANKDDVLLTSGPYIAKKQTQKSMQQIKSSFKTLPNYSASL